MTPEVRFGDCMDPATGLPSLADCSVDSMVTDPPAGIGFMGKEWDRDKGGRVSWVSWMTSVMRECVRVLKPGAHALVWALPRTSHWTATAVEDAGFEIRDVITHHFGSGFPKSLDVSKAIDAAAGAERTVVGVRASYRPEANESRDPEGFQDRSNGLVTAPATEAAKQWEGWGTALKPGTEHWILARKPLSGTVAANVQEHGTGALNIDACRVEGEPPNAWPAEARRQDGRREEYRTGGASGPMVTATAGRWPANLILSHSWNCEDGNCAEDCPVREMDRQSGDLQSNSMRAGTPRTIGNTVYGKASGAAIKADIVGSRGGASRFFTVLPPSSRFLYCAKPSTSEREEGLRHLPRTSGAEMVGRKEGAAALNSPRTGAGRSAGSRANLHPTVKSVELMTWLIKLITPPRGLVLDPFAGSGTGGVAACRHRFRWIGWEADEAYHALATERLRRAVGQLELCA